MSYVFRGTPDKPRLKSGPKPKPYDPSLCGTKLGYKQHVRFREDKCQACRDVYAAYQRELRAARKAAA